MDQLIFRQSTEPNLTELLETPGKGSMIGNGEVNLQHASQGTEEPFGLTKGKVKDHTNRQGCLDGDIRLVSRWAAPSRS